MNDSDEVWTQVLNFEGLYEVSNRGRIRSVDRATVTASGSNRFYKGTLRKLYKSQRGYLTVRLSRPNPQRVVTKSVHRLVLESFVGSSNLECRHLDGDPSNNRLENLIWGTHAENCKDRTDHGTSYKGESNPAAKLTPENILNIKSAYSSGTTQKELGIRYGVTQACISSIVLGISWSHLGE